MGSWWKRIAGDTGGNIAPTAVLLSNNEVEETTSPDILIGQLLAIDANVGAGVGEQAGDRSHPRRVAVGLGYTAGPGGWKGRVARGAGLLRRDLLRYHENYDGIVAALGSAPSGDHVFALVSDPGSKLNIINGNELVSADDFIGISPPEYAFTVRATDAGGLFVDQVLTLDILAAITNPVEDPGEVIPDDGFDDIPIAQDTSTGTKISGKSGGTAKFIFDFGPPEAGGVYTLRYSANWSGLTKNGRRAFVGFAFKTGEDFHFSGVKGDGSNPAVMHDYRISGDDNFHGASGFVQVDGGAATYAVKDGPNWLQLEVSSDGPTYILRSSSDGVSWTDEFTAITPTPLAAATDALQFGVGAFFENADKGAFVLTIESWNADLPAVPGALVTFSEDQTNQDFTTPTPISWDSQTRDVGAWWNPASPTIFTVPAGVSKVRVGFGLRIESITAGDAVSAYIEKNSSSAFVGNAKFQLDCGITVYGLTIFTAAIPVNPGDTFRAVLDAETDPSISLIASASWFTIEKVE